MSLFGTGRKEGIAAVLVLIALVFVQHAPSCWWGAAGESTTVPFVRGLTQAGLAFRDGGWPAWNEAAGLGASFRESGVPLLYPPFWPVALGWLDLAWLCAMHAALACTLAYRMLRALSASRYSAFVGAGLYGLGWFLTCAWDAPQEAFAACWLPWIVTCAWNLLFPRRRAPSAVLLGLALVIPFLTGGVVTAWLGVALGTLCILVGLLRIDRIDRQPTALYAAAAGTIAVCGTAPVWGPWMATSGARPISAADGPIPVLGLLGLLSPDLFGEGGRPVTPAVADAREEAALSAFALYPGTLVLLIALLGFLRPKRTWIPLFWICITGLALVLSIEHPLTAGVHRAAPLLASHPAAPLALFHLGVVVLVALGLENFFDAPRARPLALPVAGSAMVVAAAVSAAALTLGHEGTLSDLGVLRAGDWLADVRHASPRVLLAASALAITFLAWQRLGVLRLKRLVAVLAVGEVLILGLATHAQRVRAVEQTAALRVAAQEPWLGAAPPGSATAASTPRGASFVTGSRTLDRRPTAAEVRSEPDALIEAPHGDWEPSTAPVDVDRSSPNSKTLVFAPEEHTRLLLVSTTHHAGWQATTDRGPAPVLRADRSLQAVRVPAGATEVKLVYREPGLVAGIALAAFGSVLALGLLAFGRR